MRVRNSLSLLASVLIFGGCSRSHSETVVTPPAPSPSPATSIARDLSSVLEPILLKHGIPGIAAVVLRGDQIVATGVAGVRKAGGAERITLGDKFHLGSDTKAMTATLAAMLV